MSDDAALRIRPLRRRQGRRPGDRPGTFNMHQRSLLHSLLITVRHGSAPLGVGRGGVAALGLRRQQTLHHYTHFTDTIHSSLEPGGSHCGAAGPYVPTGRTKHDPAHFSTQSWARGSPVPRWTWTRTAGPSGRVLRWVARRGLTGRCRPGSGPSKQRRTS